MALADIAQLEALCRRMDTEAFIPLTTDELSSRSWRRVHEFGEILDIVMAKLDADGLFPKKGSRTTGGNGWYGRSAYLNTTPATLAVNTWKWSRQSPTPLWITIYGAKWDKGDPAEVWPRLGAYGTSHPASIFKDYLGFPSIALPVEAGAERDAIVDATCTELRAIAAALEAPKDAPAEVPEVAAGG